MSTMRANKFVTVGVGSVGGLLASASGQIANAGSRMDKGFALFVGNVGYQISKLEKFICVVL